MKGNNSETVFCALGGAQSVGGSCYYLRLGKNNILLDCGVGMKRGVYQAPELYSLLENGCIESYSQLSHVFLSHAHLDHIGSLPLLYRDVPNIKTYATDLTCTLTDLQLAYHAKRNANKRAYKFNAEELCLSDRCLRVAYNQQMTVDDMQIEFFSAGHIPGAMMTLLRYDGKNILYTGDYSFENTSLTQAAYLPDSLDIDVLIICGLHAKQPYYSREGNALSHICNEVTNRLSYGENVYCGVRQLSKGVELLAYLNDNIPDSVPIYIDNGVMKVVEALEEVNIPVLRRNNYLHQLKNSYWRDYFYREQPYVTKRRQQIFIGSNVRQDFLADYHYMDCDFTLHDDFTELSQFIRRINPKTAVVVHCSPGDCYYDETVEQVLMRDADCRTQFIFPEPGEVLIL